MLLSAALLGALTAACGDDKPPSVAPVTPPPADAPRGPTSPPQPPATPPGPANVPPDAPLAAGGDSDPLGGPSGTQVGTGLAPLVIQRVVRASLPTIKKCYDSALATTPTLEGRVIVTFTIEKDGSVKTAGDTGSTLPDPKVVACVTQAFRSMVFPAPENGAAVTATYPFKFQPGQAGGNAPSPAPAAVATGATTTPANPASTTPKTAPAKKTGRPNPLDAPLK